jgi:hypothetical protein
MAGASWIPLLGKRLTPGQSMEIPLSVFARNWQTIRTYVDQGVIAIEKLYENEKEKDHVGTDEHGARGEFSSQAPRAQAGDGADHRRQAAAFAELHPDF